MHKFTSLIFRSWVSPVLLCLTVLQTYAAQAGNPASAAMSALKSNVIVFLGFAVGGAMAGAALRQLVRPCNKLTREVIFSVCVFTGMGLGLFNYLGYLR